MAKVLHFVTELEAGGTQLALYRLLSAMDRERFKPVVACLYNGQGRAAQKIRDLGVPVFDMHMPARWRLDALARLYALLQREQPHILHTRLFHANLPGRLLGRLAGVPVVISSEQSMGQEGRLRMWLDRLTVGFSDRVVCVSRSVADFAQQHIGLPAQKLRVIYNGIDPAEYAGLPGKLQARRALGLPAEGWMVGGLGRLDPVKGFPVLIAAFAQIASQNAQGRLVIAGEGKQRLMLQSQIQEFGLEGKVLLIGHCEQPALFLSALDVLALPSHHEGLPNVVLEAMAVGLPVVASAVGGVPEQIVEGETGLLVPPGETVALAQALARLQADPHLGERLGRAGKAKVAREFSLAEMVRRTEDLYAELLTEKGLVG